MFTVFRVRITGAREFFTCGACVPIGTKIPSASNGVKVDADATELPF